MKTEAKQFSSVLTWSVHQAQPANKNNNDFEFLVPRQQFFPVMMMVMVFRGLNVFLTFWGDYFRLLAGIRSQKGKRKLEKNFS